jgi:hypothetical protein
LTVLETQLKEKRQDAKYKEYIEVAKIQSPIAPSQ